MSDVSEDGEMLEWCGSVCSYNKIGHAVKSREYKGIKFDVLFDALRFCLLVRAYTRVAGQFELLYAFDYSATGQGVFGAVRCILDQKYVLDRAEKRINELEACILDMANGGG